MLYSEIGYVPTLKGDRLEPALMILRGKKAVAIPLSMAHEFTEDATALRKAMKYAGILFEGAFTRSEVFALVDKITWGLVDLVQAPMAPPLNSPAQIQKRLESQRVHFMADGQTIVDAR